jgi:hypothetical protein
MSTRILVTITCVNILLILNQVFMTMFSLNKNRNNKMAVNQN